MSQLMAISYTDDAVLTSRDPDLSQQSLYVMVGLFEHVGLPNNMTKTKVMTCMPGKIHSRHST